MPLTSEDMKQLVQAEQKKYIPNLYTGLSVTDDKQHTEIITANDIIVLAREMSLSFLEKLESSQGNGSQDNPYQLDTPASWFSIAAHFIVMKDSTEKKYLCINQQLFTIEVKDRYISFDTVTKKESFSQFLAEGAPTLMEELLNPAHQLFAKENFEISNNTMDSIEQVQSIVPLGIHAIQTMNAKFKKTSEEQRPTYASLAEKKADLENFISDRLSDFELDSAITKFMNPQEESESQTSFANMAGDIKPALQAILNAFLDSNHVPKEKKQTVIDLVSPILECINEVDYASIPNNASPKELLFSFFDPLILKLFDEPAEFQEKMQNIWADFPEILKKINLTQSHCDKAKPLADLGSVYDIRAILASKASKPRQHLYPIVAPLFFSETSRYPISFIASLALLDLIQMQRKTPDSMENYTVQNLLENPQARHKFIDAYGSWYSLKFKYDFYLKRPQKTLKNRAVYIYLDDNTEQLKYSLKAEDGTIISAVLSQEELSKHYDSILKKAIAAEQKLSKNEIIAIHNKVLENGHIQATCQCLDCKDYKKRKEVFYKTLSPNPKKKNQNADFYVSNVYKNPKPGERSIDEVICGYHPMVQGNSFLDTIPEADHYNTGYENLQKEESLPSSLNLVQQKIASILLDWLSIRLQEKGYQVKLLKERLVPIDLKLQKKQAQEQNKKDDKLRELVKSFFTERMQTFDFINVSEVPNRHEAFSSKSTIDDTVVKISDNLAATFFGNSKENIVLEQVMHDGSFKKTENSDELSNSKLP